MQRRNWTQLNGHAATQSNQLQRNSASTGSQYGDGWSKRLPKIVEQFRGKLSIHFAGSTWMNDGITEDYLHKIIGLKLFGGKRLLVWDAFGSHKSAGTTKVLKELGVEAAYIPGGCTRSWQELSKEMIIKSFEVCGLATTSDGYGDDRINCFKPDGSIGTRGIDLLREFRGKETMKDGRNDVEEAGLSEDENNVELSGVGEDDELFFQI